VKSQRDDPLRPRVRVNQLGYLPDAPQQATLVTDAVEPVEFTVGDWRGWSRPWPQRPEPTSGLNVHVLDFTAACAHGDDVRIAAGDARSHPFRVAPDVYRDLAADALAFFRRMRCEHPDTAVAAWTGPDAERFPLCTFAAAWPWRLFWGAALLQSSRPNEFLTQGQEGRQPGK